MLSGKDLLESTMNHSDVIIIGAGAAGLMCAIEAGKRGRSVLVLDHANKAGKKILMSGGGRCNFTNNHIDATENFISHNPHFCKSALKRYTPTDFIKLVNEHQIPFHEKAHGQLFCDNKSKDILNMLLEECEKSNVNIQLNTCINHIEPFNKTDNARFKIKTSNAGRTCASLVVASGGLSIPTMGASPFGYQIAEQFAIKVLPTRAALVPFTLQPADKEKLSALSGISVDCLVRSQQKSFRENILFTHRGLSGPAILQISSYWRPGESIIIDMLPDLDLSGTLKILQKQKPKLTLKTALNEHLPKRVVTTFLSEQMLTKTIATFSYKELDRIANTLHQWTIKPNGTEGYRTAEVTLGGVDCDAISSKTMETKTVPGLYFIGEVLDVTGWLGGFNFQWAWASGFAAGQVV